MIRTLLWILGGLLLGGVIHLVTILALPRLAEETLWTRVSAIEAQNVMTVLPEIQAGQANPLHLDPDVVYGICQLDLTQGPAYLSGILPDAFWSIALFEPSGTIAYSTTNRDGIGQSLEMGIFNAAQTRLLAQQQIDIEEGLLVIESPANQIFALVRLAPPHEAMRARFAEKLAAVRCGPQT
ncbi:hypothetical protein IC608_07695 [Devosia sp. PTR5]|uniref:DUF1254 domain-containing protein n=1 Tax=Devosia oryzisoli TaxID=2774138 RepID=A0A927FUG3_9HYPH|nr:hypothetical protein [Devosia oryzisoli]MBD8065354.1 hypothetical protein [Devosia oryzisoli]